MSEVVNVILGEDTEGNKLTWNISLKGSPHGVIVGIPGQGKSVTTRNILNQFAAQGLPSGGGVRCEMCHGDGNAVMALYTPKISTR